MTSYKRKFEDSEWIDSLTKCEFVSLFVPNRSEGYLRLLESSSEKNPIVVPSSAFSRGFLCWKEDTVSPALIARLAKYREATERWRLKSPESPYAKWQKHARDASHAYFKFGTQLHTYDMDERTQRRTGTVYVDSVDKFGELVWDSTTDVRGNGNTGWFADSFQDSCIRFGVCKIKTKKFYLYVAVTWNDSCDGVTLRMRDSYKVYRSKTQVDDSNNFEYDEREAVDDVMRYADRCAEREAEEEREYQAKDQAEQMIESLKETIDTSKDELRELLRERRTHKQTEAPAVCASITRTARELIRKIRESRERIEKLQENFWYAVEGY